MDYCFFKYKAAITHKPTSYPVEKMNRNIKPIARRQFLKNGIAGAAAAAFIPVKNLFSTSSTHSKVDVNSQERLSKKSIAKLRQIAHKYGSEFGELRIEH